MYEYRQHLISKKLFITGTSQQIFESHPHIAK